MGEKEYLQAASMKALLNGLSGLHLMEDGSVSPKDKHGFRPGRFFKHGKVAAELLARFAALEAERDALRARLAEAVEHINLLILTIEHEAPSDFGRNGVVSECGKDEGETRTWRTIGEAYDFVRQHTAPPAAQPPEPQPPTAEGDTT